MQTQELAAAMHEGEESSRGGFPDVDRLRERGRRRRRLRLGGNVVVAAALLGVAGAIVPMVLGGGQAAQTVVATASQRGADVLSPYERRALREMPGARSVGGVVVVPVQPDAESLLRRFADSEIAGRIAPLGRNGYVGPGYSTSPSFYPRFMRGEHPADTQIAEDTGPVSLACAVWEKGEPCGVAVLVGSAEAGWSYLYGLGTDDFLTPGSGMEVFLDEAYDDDLLAQSVIGGFDGTEATRVVLTLADGSTSEASIDSGDISAGDTLFWATVASELAQVTAYDAEGAVVLDHAIQPCDDPVDCEVR